MPKQPTPLHPVPDNATVPNAETQQTSTPNGVTALNKIVLVSTLDKATAALLPYSGEPEEWDEAKDSEEMVEAVRKFKDELAMYILLWGRSVGITDLRLQHIQTLTRKVKDPNAPPAAVRSYWNTQKLKWHHQREGEEFPAWLDNLFNLGTAADLQYPKGKDIPPQAFGAYRPPKGASRVKRTKFE